MGRATESIRISKEAKKELDERKVVPAESYNDVIERLVGLRENPKTSSEG